ncbi:kinase-like domain-containing protein [Cubamyces menziesii]|nr:kinase-like domain-containing protein [Cubamyces menziesii]
MPEASSSFQATSEPKKLPSYVFLPPEIAEHYAEQTRKGSYKLLPAELEWRKRREFLDKKGYTLRPRYALDWEPSWIGTNIAPDFCEDSIILNDSRIMDARRQNDNKLVAIKRVRRDSRELEIAQFLTSVGGSDHHCISVLEVLDDPLDPGRSLLVMPYLRPYDNPEFNVVADVVDFAMQTLKGLTFMHQHRIAHRDIAPTNIMMDGTPLYPEGFHPVRIHQAEDAIYDARPLPRIDHPVTYYYIDFGLSVRFAEGAPSLVVGKVGQRTDVPEMSSTVPYDAFKADVYALGDIFDRDLEQKWKNVHFLRPLIEIMKQPDPCLRPPAHELLKMFRQIRATLHDTTLRWRLVLRTEQPYERLFNDTVAVARSGLSNLKRMVG